MIDLQMCVVLDCDCDDSSTKVRGTLKLCDSVLGILRLRVVSVLHSNDLIIPIEHYGAFKTF